MLKFIKNNTSFFKKILLVCFVFVLCFVFYNFVYFGTVNVRLNENYKKQNISLSVYNNDYELVNTYNKDYFSMRLKKGSYILVLSTADNENDHEIESSIIKQRFIINPRKTTVVNIGKDEAFKNIELKTKQNFYIDGLIKNNMLITDSVGNISTRGFDQEKINENLKIDNVFDVVGSCGMSNKNILTVDRFGRYYLFNGDKKQEIDIRSISYGRDGVILENIFYNSKHLYFDSNFICINDSLIINRKGIINKNGEISRLSSDLEKMDNVNSFASNGGLLALFNRFSVDDQDHDSKKQKDSSVYFFDNSFNLSRSVMVSDNISGLSFLDQKYFCYSVYDFNSIKCSRDGGESYFIDKKLTFSNEPPGSVLNIHLLDDSNVVYTTPNSVWLLNLNDLTSREILNSKFSFGYNSIVSNPEDRYSFALNSYSGGVFDSKLYKLSVFRKN